MILPRNFIAHKIILPDSAGVILPRNFIARKIISPDSAGVVLPRNFIARKIISPDSAGVILPRNFIARKMISPDRLCRRDLAAKFKIVIGGATANFLSAKILAAFKMNRIIFIAAVVFVMNFAPRVFANQIIPGGQIEAMAIAEIERALDERGEFRRREINLQRSLADVSLPKGIIDIKIVLPAMAVNYTGVTPVKARIFLGGRLYRDVNFAVLVKVFDTVLIANHDLRIEIPVTESDFRLAEISVDGRAEYIQDPREIVGLVPHRIIRAGSPISVNYFQQPMVIASGQPVRIVVRYKGMEVSAKGITMTRGRVGQMIKVKNESSQKVLSAKVLDSQTVEVNF